MTNERTGLYEGMFLFPQSATSNLQDSMDHVRGILDASNATIINFRKWDDRRLAYEIDGNKRGVYFLVFFNAPTSALSEIERRCNQSEQLLRMMITRGEHLPIETIEANEGAEELATEIKLRGTKTTEKENTATSKVSRKTDAAPETSTPKPVQEPAEALAEEIAEVSTKIEIEKDIKEITEA